MKRIACLVALMALGSPACAHGYSFMFHGHSVHIASHCRSLSCVSVSGLGNRRNQRDDDVAATNAPAPAAVLAQPAPAPAPAALPATRAPTAQAIQPQPARPAPALASAPPAPPPAVGFETPPQRPTPPDAIAQNTAVPPPAAPDTTHAKPQDKPAAAARPSKETESTVADSPLGDWRSDGKNGGLVHIEACGTALCGYAFDPSTRTKGESVLVNMKPKNDTKWTGNVYSRSSGNSYYGTMTLKPDRDTLRVEACAIGQFFCSGNDWTRVGKGDELVSSQHAQPEPRS